MRTLINEKDQLREYKKKGKKTMCNNLGHDSYKQMNRLKKMTKKERWKNVFKLQTKETVFLIMFKRVAWLIHQCSLHQLSD